MHEQNRIFILKPKKKKIKKIISIVNLDHNLIDSLSMMHGGLLPPNPSSTDLLSWFPWPFLFLWRRRHICWWQRRLVLFRVFAFCGLLLFLACYFGTSGWVFILFSLSLGSSLLFRDGHAPLGGVDTLISKLITCSWCVFVFSWLCFWVVGSLLVFALCLLCLVGGSRVSPSDVLSFVEWKVYLTKKSIIHKQNVVLFSNSTHPYDLLKYIGIMKADLGQRSLKKVRTPTCPMRYTSGTCTLWASCGKNRCNPNCSLSNRKRQRKQEQESQKPKKNRAATNKFQANYKKLL